MINHRFAMLIKIQKEREEKLQAQFVKAQQFYQQAEQKYQGLANYRTDYIQQSQQQGADHEINKTRDDTADGNHQPWKVNLGNHALIGNKAVSTLGKCGRKKLPRQHATQHQQWAQGNPSLGCTTTKVAGFLEPHQWNLPEGHMVVPVGSKSPHD